MKAPAMSLPLPVCSGRGLGGGYWRTPVICPSPHPLPRPLPEYRATEVGSPRRLKIAVEGVALACLGLQVDGLLARVQLALVAFRRSHDGAGELAFFPAHPRLEPAPSAQASDHAAGPGLRQ